MGEMPTVHPAYNGRPHSHFYYSSSPYKDEHRPSQAISKVSVPPSAGVAGAAGLQQAKEDVFVLGTTQFVQELCLVPKTDSKEEDDCWLLTYVHDAGALKT